MVTSLCLPCLEGDHDRCETDPCGEPNCDMCRICTCEHEENGR